MIFPEWLKIYGEKDYRNKKCPVEDAELVNHKSIEENIP